VVMVFLVLAAQYESWSLPLAVILVVPMCLLSAIVGVRIAQMDVNIFTRIGFVVLVGLASKNAILIVEFAKLQRLSGRSRRDATLEACKLRLRPIIMTSLAFILGVVPLMTSRGAGAEMRQTLGIAVFSGMLGVTLFGILLTPVFFYSIDWLGEQRIFTSRFMPALNHASLAVITLQPLRWTARMAWHRLSAKRQAHRAEVQQIAEQAEAESYLPTPPVNGKSPVHLKKPSMLKHREAADAVTSDD
jgi:multidrug efflux pump